MIPAIIMAMGFYAIYLNLGLLNSIPGLIVADSTIAVPFGVLIFTAFMSGIPDELTQAARMVTDAGLRVSSLCRGGFLTAEPGPERDRAIDDNRRAIDEAAALSADCLVMVVGGLPEGSRDLAGARDRVAEAIAALGGVSEVYSVTGAIDLIALIRVAQHDQVADVVAGLWYLSVSTRTWPAGEVRGQIRRTEARVHGV